jgi:hypothetical protein
MDKGLPGPDALAMAEASIGAFLSRLEAEGRNPDPWEGEQLVEALLALKRHDYGGALEHVRAARIPPCGRDPAMVEVTAPRLAILQAIFDMLCPADSAPSKLH